jgi:CheY-like chemotaxis protein
MPARVLVIDDSTMLLELAVTALKQAGYDAAGATDLASLDRQLSTGPFDLILVDVKMPEMFGDDVVEFLKQQKGIKSKLLLYSDIPEEELQQRVASSGADGAISKATGIEGVLAAVAARLQVRKKRILIVDDSETTVMLLQAELEGKGFEIHTANTAEKATKIILKKQTRPDLVLLDVQMPNVNGEQFCRFIKQNSLFMGIKVLLCSGMEEKELQRICREAGADGYVAKDQVLGRVLSRELQS